MTRVQTCALPICIRPCRRRLTLLPSLFPQVPRKAGGNKLAVRWRVLNESVAKRPFRMLTLKRLLTCVQRNDFGISIDLKDAYFHVPIKLKHRIFQRFAFDGMKYEYTPNTDSIVPRQTNGGGSSRGTRDIAPH